ncbi:MAG: hypothetical protein E7679_01250 [Ruminococcaceae bacterium]|nr:hypothetical protein [Oscillospiraceae bacterium]
MIGNIFKNNKKKIADLLMSICATAVFNMVIQFAIYPLLEGGMGSEQFGIALSVLSVVAILSGTVGSAANYSRMVTTTKKDIAYTNGDYNLIVLTLSLMCAIGGVFYLRYVGISSALPTLLFVFLIILSSLRYYCDAEYKIRGDFLRYMLFYIAVSLGYIIGIFIYSFTDQWMFTFIIGEAFSVLFVLIWGTTFRKNALIPSKNFSLVCGSMGFLLLSTLIDNLTLNADRLLLMLFVSGDAVSIYYIASLLGKVIAMLSVPLNSLIISYLIKYKGTLTKKLWGIASAAALALGAAGFAVCAVISPFILGILYPDPHIQSSISPYITPAILGQVFYFVSGILLVILLRFRGERKQFFFNAAYALEFFIIVIISTAAHGLRGFVYSSLAANAIRFVAVMIWGFIPPQRKISKKRRYIGR